MPALGRQQLGHHLHVHFPRSQPALVSLGHGLEVDYEEPMIGLAPDDRIGTRGKHNILGQRHSILNLNFDHFIFIQPLRQPDSAPGQHQSLNMSRLLIDDSRFVGSIFHSKATSRDLLKIFSLRTAGCCSCIRPLQRLLQTLMYINPGDEWNRQPLALPAGSRSSILSLILPVTSSRALLICRNR